MTASRRTDRRSAAALAHGRTPELTSAVRFAVVCAALVLAMRLWLEYVGPLPGDRWVVGHRESVWLLPSQVLDVIVFFSVAGSPAVALCTVVVALPFVMRAAGARGAAFFVVATAGVLVNVLLKELSGPTPLMVEIRGGFAELNFPSGHAVYGVVTFGALAALARRCGRADIAIAFVALAVAMAISRVAAGAHFLSDVVAGVIMGVGWLAVAAALTLGSVRRRKA